MYKEKENDKPFDVRGWIKRLAALRNIRPLLLLVWKTSRLAVVSSLALVIISALRPVAILWVSKLIMDRLVATVSRHEPVASDLWLLVGLEFGLVASGELLASLSDINDSLLADRFNKDMNVKVMEHAANLDLAPLESPSFYDKLERARTQTQARLGVLRGIAGAIQELITLLSLSVAIFYYSPILLALVVVTVIPSLFVETHFALVSYAIFERRAPQRRELEYIRYLGASAENAKEVKIFGLEHHLIERYKRLADQFYEETRSLVTRRATIGGLLKILATGGYYTTYAVIVYHAIKGKISIGDFTLLAGTFGRSRAGLQSIFSQFVNMTNQSLFVNDLFDFFKITPTVCQAKNPLPAPRPIRRGFEFRNVSFMYEGSEKKILKDVSFRLEAGEHLALIGENGAGKTTLVKLLARLYDPTEGVILLDGVDLRKYDLADLRKEIAVVFQDYVRYSMSVRENIGFGKIDDLHDQGRVEQSARESNAFRIVERLPQRFNQMLGRRFEGGVDLSAGEWQKIALARAYMRKAQLLVLDEPTASMDARAEHEIFKTFNDLMKGRTAILISHRFATVRMADRILVLEGGVIREQGTHQRLMRLAGRYAELFQLQAQGYQ